jgi:hypothetical protein
VNVSIPSNLFARYLLTSRWYSREKNEVKFAAFMPNQNPDSAVLETSVYQISDIEESEIWAIGQREVVEIRPGRRLHGRADITEGKVGRQGLEISVNNIPPRHATIVSWPDERSEQILRATELAASSNLHLL